MNEYSRRTNCQLHAKSRILGDAGTIVSVSCCLVGARTQESSSSVDTGSRNRAGVLESRVIALVNICKMKGQLSRSTCAGS